MEAEYMLLGTKKDALSVLNEFGYPLKVISLLITDMQGLAMSRSFGDNVSKAVGVTHIP